MKCLVKFTVFWLFYILSFRYACSTTSSGVSIINKEIVVHLYNINCVEKLNYKNEVLPFYK